MEISHSCTHRHLKPSELTYPAHYLKMDNPESGSTFSGPKQSTK